MCDQKGGGTDETEEGTYHVDNFAAKANRLALAIRGALESERRRSLLKER